MYKRSMALLDSWALVRFFCDSIFALVFGLESKDTIFYVNPDTPGKEAGKDWGFQNNSSSRLISTTFSR